jgi:hypothetical protein
VTFGDFYVMFQRENHFINKRIQKPRRLNMKYIPAVNSVNKTNRNRYNSQSWKFNVKFFIANGNSYCSSPCIILYSTYKQNKLLPPFVFSLITYPCRYIIPLNIIQQYNMVSELLTLITAYNLPSLLSLLPRRSLIRLLLTWT